MTSAITWVCADWQPLAAQDPVPGDPEGIRDLATGYDRSADDVDQQGAAVRAAGVGRGADAMMFDGWEGPAAQAFHTQAAPLTTELSAVAHRLRGFAAALRGYASDLEAAQRRARSALAQARDVQVQAQVTAAARPAGAPDPSGGLLAQEDPALTHARAQLRRACAERDEAAARCAAAMARAGHDSLRNPSRWHHVLGVISQWAGSLSAWFGIAALVLCWVPGVGQVLGGIALGLSLLQLAADLGLAASGDASLATLGVDVFGVLPMGKAARLGAVMSHADAVERATARISSKRWVRASVGRRLRSMATPERFERTRGLHGLATLPESHPGRLMIDGVEQVQLGIRAAACTRSPMAFLHSPGGVLEELGRARQQGRRGVLWLFGGHGVDAAQAAIGAPGLPTFGTAR